MSNGKDGKAEGSNAGLAGVLELVVDPIDERMEELAALTSAWQKNRDRKRPSPILRKAIIMAAGELWDAVAMFEEEQTS